MVTDVVKKMDFVYATRVIMDLSACLVSGNKTIYQILHIEGEEANMMKLLHFKIQYKMN